MAKLTIESIIKTSIVSAFTIAAALIWKDVIVDIINYIVPPQAQLLYKFIAAIIATLIAIMGIYILLKTEDEAKDIIMRLERKK